MLLSALSAPPPPLPAADLILVNGKVWAGDGLPPAQAVAVAGERIVAVGTDEEALARQGKSTRVRNLHGRLVVPGFNDAHVHLLDGGFGLLSVDLRPATDEADMARRLAAHAKTLPNGRWITQGNWDQEAWPSKRLPSRASVDAAAPDNPVFVQRLDGHIALASSRALSLAGVTRETKDPAGGTIDRDASGEPTGILRDNALDLVARVVPEPTREENLAAARAALAHAASLGVTSLQDNSSAAALKVYQELKARGELTARVNVWRNASLLPDLARAGVATGLGDDWVRVGALKVLFDGSMGAGSPRSSSRTRTTRGRGASSCTSPRSWRGSSARPTQRGSSSPSTPSATGPTPSSSTRSRGSSRSAGPTTDASGSSTRRSSAPPTSTGGSASAPSRRSSRRTRSTTCAGPRSGSARPASPAPTTSARSWRRGSRSPSGQTGSSSRSTRGSPSTRPSRARPPREAPPAAGSPRRS